MTLRHLRIFVMVCDTGSVTAAGEKLYIAQPSVSLAISELEDYYGIKLFDRISKRLHITETGKQFLQYATHIVALFDELEKGTKNWDSMGVLRIGTSITIGNYLLPKYVETFVASHPHIKVHATIDNSQMIEASILKNEIDIGLIEGVIHSPYIESKCFMDDHLVVICAADHLFARYEEVSLAQLQDEHFILREKGSAGREIFDGILEAHAIKITPTWQSTSTQAIVRAVSKNLGISILPYLLVKDSLDRNEIRAIHVKDVSLSRKFHIIYHKHKFLTKSAKDFISLCK